jgi:hypothetical protein
MHDQYLLDKRTQRQVPGLLIGGAFEAIASPKHLFGLMHELSSSLAGKHIQMWSADPSVQGLISGLGWDGATHNAAGGDYLNLASRLHYGISGFDNTRFFYPSFLIPTLGFSRDGAYFAFEEFGILDGF